MLKDWELAKACQARVYGCYVEVKVAQIILTSSLLCNVYDLGLSLFWACCKRHLFRKVLWRAMRIFFLE